jgi:hypothetical protein
VAAERGSPAAIEQAHDLLSGIMSRQPYGSAWERPVPSRHSQGADSEGAAAAAATDQEDDARASAHRVHGAR